ncbi:hypothetical protein ACLQ2Y_16330 [Micromonospora echinospora]|uniref:Membrane protease YdiL (CAAX protease family) n=1 Tax=Micromonospora echinospora TaxID=1877 RepID=A0ABR6MIF3_MICEC|nr:membrane protease YdiL (CAAX protease family) [Micromonospora echinospora]
MTTDVSTAGRHPRAGRVVLLAGLGLIAVAVIVLVATGNTGVRYSADHDGTVPMWSRWIPALAGIALIRLIPPASDPRWPDPVAPYREAVPLLLAGIAFAAVMPLLGGEPAYTVLKLALLLGVPAAVFLAARRRPPRWRPGPAPADAAHRWGPALPVAVWLVLSYATPLAVPASDWGRTVTPVELVVTLLVAFAVNALLEEVFYRRWLQTRWESLLGGDRARVAGVGGLARGHPGHRTAGRRTGHSAGQPRGARALPRLPVVPVPPDVAAAGGARRAQRDAHAARSLTGPLDPGIGHDPSSGDRAAAAARSGAATAQPAVWYHTSCTDHFGNGQVAVDTPPTATLGPERLHSSPQMLMQWTVTQTVPVPPVQVAYPTPAKSQALHPVGAACAAVAGVRAATLASNPAAASRLTI